MIWNEAAETMPRAALARLQGERLRDVAARLWAAVPFYRHQWEGAGLHPDSIRGVDDLPRIPFTRKSDLRDNYPFGMFALPREQAIRIHASSGTTGKPTVVGYTRDDLEMWAEVCARGLAASGAVPGDLFQNAYGYGLFTGGLGMHYGAERMGLSVVPISGGNTARQILLLRDFGAQLFACTPSYALTIADALLAEGVGPGELPVKSFILGAEPWTEGMRQEIEERLGVDAVNIYGLSEIIGPGVSCECVEAKDGSHVCEDHFLVEVLDPATGDPLPDGTVGELVFTTLTKQATPLLRYRTGDLAALNREPCRCGRTHARMGRVVGRVDDMLIVRGINVFPSQIAEALGGIPTITPHHHILVTRANRLDVLEVQVEVAEPFFLATGGADALAVAGSEPHQQLVGTLRDKLYGTLGIVAQVTLLAPGMAPRSEGGKLSRVTDRRG